MLTKLPFLTVVYTLFLVISSNAQIQKPEIEIIRSFTGNYEVIRNHGISSIDIYLNPTGTLTGDYCITMDTKVDCGDNLLNNPTIIDNTTVNFDWTSGYWPNLTGTLQVRILNENQIGIVMLNTSHSKKFDFSPLANFLYLKDAVGENATGEMVFSRVK
jgi:hypothetical protein